MNNIPLSNFKLCCSNSRKIKYNILHDPKPIHLIPEMRKSIDRMLWYVPGIDSVQSYNNYLVDDLLYSEAIFEIVLDEMGLKNSNDVKIVDGKKLEKPEADYFDHEICLTCQKILITKYKSETIFRSMLRHIRNSIAHGNFIVLDNLVLFIDQLKLKAGNKEKTALVKIDIIAFDKILKLIEEYDEFTESLVLARAFKNLGYDVKKEARVGGIILDLLITKDGLKYGIEIKDEKRKHEIGYNDNMIKSLIYSKSELKKHNIIPVFIYDKSRVSDKAKNFLDATGVILLDKRNIAELINNEEVLER